MTRKIYKSAMGKTVDLGALLLQNEQVRAVGNMGVNAAGDLIDSSNRVIDQKNRQVQRHYRRQTNVSADAFMATSNLAAKKMQNQPNDQEFQTTEDFFAETKQPEPTMPETPDDAMPKSGGLAAAIARNREVKQELEKTRRQQLAEQGLKKI